MFKPYSRNIRKITNILNNTYLQDIQKVQLNKLLTNCLFTVREPYSSCNLNQYMEDTNKYCIILCNYHVRNQYSTEIDIFSPKCYSHMYRVASENYLDSGINSIYDYYVSDTCYVIPTNFTNINQINKIIKSEELLCLNLMTEIREKQII